MADGHGGFGDLAAPLGGGPSPAELAKYEMNDFGNAMRLIRMAGGEIRADGKVDLSSARLMYLREHGWIGFNGRHWDLKDGEGEALRLAHRVAKGLWAQAEIIAAQLEADAKSKGGEPPKRMIAAAYDFAESAGNAGRSSAMLRQAQAYLQVDLDAFDRDPLALNVRNGTLKFRRTKAGGKPGFEMTFQDRHDPADRITRMAEVDYDPNATAPALQQALTVWQPQEVDRRYLQVLVGYGVTADTSEQIFIIFQGLGRDGKSTFMNALRKLLGSYAATADVKTFLDIGQRGGGDASPDIARLAGDTRMISTAEPPKNAKLADHMIKSFTGGGNVTTRRLKQDLFEFEPVGKVFMECNGRPQPQGADEGIWRRLKLLLWENQIPADQADKELPHKLEAERPGVLNWILEGVGRWLVEGVKDPPRVKVALSDYRKGSSSFAEWLSDCVARDKAATTPASDFFKSYKAYMEERDEKAMTQTAFGRALADQQIIRGPKDGKGNATRTGARLKSDAERQADEPPSGDVSAGGPLGGEAFSMPPDEEPDDPFGPVG